MEDEPAPQRRYGALAIAAWATVVGLLALNVWMWFGSDGSRSSASPADDPAATVVEGEGGAVGGAAVAPGSGFLPGDCVSWDTDLGRPSAEVVDCGVPHLVEVAGEVDLADDPSSGDAYPSDDGWATTLAAACAPVVDAYLGAPLDPSGPWAVGGLPTAVADWAAGSRRATCGVVAAARSATTGEPAPSVGSARPLPG